MLDFESIKKRLKRMTDDPSDKLAAANVARHSYVDVPDLVAEVDRLQSENAALREVLEWALPAAHSCLKDHCNPDDPNWQHLERARAVLNRGEG